MTANQPPFPSSPDPAGAPAGQPYPQAGAPAEAPAGAPAGAPYPPAPAAQYPPPAGAPYGAPGVNPYAAAAAPVVKPAPFWPGLFVALAVLGGIALLLPWFKPQLGGRTAPDEPVLHSWNGVIFYLVPILMLVSAVRAVTAKGNVAQFRAASVTAIVTGVLTMVSVVVGWARVPSNYTDWDLAQAYADSHGLSLTRGPLLGFWMAAVVAVLFVALGIAGVLFAKRATAGR